MIHRQVPAARRSREDLLLARLRKLEQEARGSVRSHHYYLFCGLLTSLLVDVALQQYGYKVLADWNFEDADSCGANYGAHWLDIDGGRCMRLVYEDNWTGKWLPAAEDVIKKAEENHGMPCMARVCIAVLT